MQGSGFEVSGVGSGLLLCIFPVRGWFQILALSLLLIANNSYGNEKPLSPVCTRSGNKTGEVKHSCLLPYKNSYTIDSYLTALKENLGDKLASRIDRINSGYSSRIKALFSHSPPDFNAMKDEIDSTLDTTEEVSKDRPEAGLIYSLVSFLRYYLPDKNMPQHTKIIHVIYAFLKGWHIHEAPNMSMIRFQGKSVLFTGYWDKKYGHWLKTDGDIYYQDINDAFFLYLFSRVRLKLLGSTPLWVSYQSTKWLVDNIPELQDGEVIELGAGSGIRASLLELLGVNIRATDIDVSSQVHHWTTVEELSANSAIRKYTEASVFLIEFPGWRIIEDTDEQGYSTMQLIIAWLPVTLVWISEKYKVDYVLSKYNLLYAYLDIEITELPLEVSDVVDENLSSPDLVVCVFRDKSTEPSRKKIQASPPKEEL